MRDTEGDRNQKAHAKHVAWAFIHGSPAAISKNRATNL